MNFLKELEKYPHVIEYNPDGYRGGANFLVRLPGVGMKDPDMKHLGETRDILGFGVSREEAAENALRAAGIYRRPRFPKVRRTVDAHHNRTAFPLWNSSIASGHH